MKMKTLVRGLVSSDPAYQRHFWKLEPRLRASLEQAVWDETRRRAIPLQAYEVWKRVGYDNVQYHCTLVFCPVRREIVTVSWRRELSSDLLGSRPVEYVDQRPLWADLHGRYWGQAPVVRPLFPSEQLCADRARAAQEGIDARGWAD